MEKRGGGKERKTETERNHDPDLQESVTLGREDNSSLWNNLQAWSLNKTRAERQR